MIYKKEGKKLTWDKELAKRFAKFYGPVRPELEMNVYEEYVKSVSEKQKPKILILGSTPEFRDLLFKYKITPICCDINPEVFSALKKLVKRKGDEVFIHSNWLESSKIISEKFDLILGHVVVNMIPDKKQPMFFKNVCKLLKDDGIFLTTVYIKSKNISKINSSSGFERYRKNSKRWKSIKEFFNTIYPDVMISLAKNRPYFTPDLMLKEIESLFKANLISKQEKDKMMKILPPGKVKVYVSEESSIEKELQYFFRLKKILLSVKYFDPQNFPIFELKKRNIILAKS